MFDGHRHIGCIAYKSNWDIKGSRLEQEENGPHTEVSKKTGEGCAKEQINTCNNKEANPIFCIPVHLPQLTARSPSWQSGPWFSSPRDREAIYLHMCL